MDFSIGCKKGLEFYKVEVNGEPVGMSVILSNHNNRVSFSIVSKNEPIPTMNKIYNALSTPSEGAQATHGPSANVMESVLALEGFDITDIDYDDSGPETFLRFTIMESDYGLYMVFLFNISSGFLTVKSPKTNPTQYKKVFNKLNKVIDLLPVEDYSIELLDWCNEGS